MSDHLDPLGHPLAEEELEQARAFAEALDSGESLGSDPQAMAVVRLLEAVAHAEDRDAQCASLLRGQLAASVSKPRSRWVRGLAAAAALVAAVLLAAVLLKLNGTPSNRLLEEREQMARRALSPVALLSEPHAGVGEPTAWRYRRQWQARATEALESARYTRLAGGAAASSLKAADSSAADPGGNS